MIRCPMDTMAPYLMRGLALPVAERRATYKSALDYQRLAFMILCPGISLLSIRTDMWFVPLKAALVATGVCMGDGAYYLFSKRTGDKTDEHAICEPERQRRERK